MGENKMEEVKKYIEDKEIIDKIECYLGLMNYKLVNSMINKEEEEKSYLDILYHYKYSNDDKFLVIEFYVYVNFVKLRSKVYGMRGLIRDKKFRFESDYFSNIKELEEWLVKIL